MLDRPEEYQRMAEFESRLWWYRALHHMIERAVSTHQRSRNARVVDAGCGTGGLLMFLQARGFRELSGFDVSPHAVALCETRGLPVRRGDLRNLEQILADECPDVIVSNDTLYFLDRTEQTKVLRSVARALAPGGMAIMNVPALRCFRGIHDVSVGITNRFTKSESRALVAEADLTASQILYWPFLLSLPIYLARFAQRRRLERGAQVEVSSEVALPPRPLNWAFEMITRAENAALPWKPIGSSLFIVAHKRS